MFWDHIIRKCFPSLMPPTWKENAKSKIFEDPVPNGTARIKIGIVVEPEYNEGLLYLTSLWS